MAGFSRKELKQDKFVEEVEHGVAYFTRHRKQVVGVAITAIALVVGVVALVGYQRSRATGARTALNDAIRLYHGIVSLEERPGIVVYGTTGERTRRVTEAMENVASEYSGRPEAAAAEYYLALLEVEQGRGEEATGRLERALPNADGEYESLIRLALAEEYARRGDVDAAKKQYEALMANPSVVVPAERAKLSYGRFLAKSDPQAAKAVLEELMATPGAAAVAAGVALRDLSGT